MRICHVGIEIVPFYDGVFVGGLAKNVATVTECQVEHGHDPEIFTSDIRKSIPNGQMTSYGLVRSIKTWGVYGSTPFGLTFVMRASAEIKKAHREQAFDIIHVHSAYSSMGSIAYLLKSAQVPKILSLYSLNLGVWSGHYKHGASGRLTEAFAKQFLEMFDKVIVPSANLKSYLTGLGICEDRIEQIPPAIAPAMLQSLPSREQARQGLNIPIESFVVLYLGNYSLWKGIGELLRAIAIIHDDFPDVTLLAAWGEPYRWSGNRKDSILELIDRYGLRDVIRHVGIVQDVRSVLRASDVLVSPFRCMCKVLHYPLSIMEAMACERPVISTRLGGIPELLGEGERGVLLEPHDLSGLAGAIESFRHDPGTGTRMGLRGSRWVREHFKPELVSGRLESLYSRLGESHPAIRR